MCKIPTVMAFAKNIGKNKIFFNLHGGGDQQIINDPPQKTKTKNKKNKKKNPLNAISDAQF